METLSARSCSTRGTLYDRVSKLLKSFQWTDCSFVLGNEVIKAHRLILAISSPVFQAMLYGPMAQVENIVVPDIDPEVFRMLLNFIYTDKVAIKSIDHACSLLYAAKKYILPYLVDLCVDYIEVLTTIENVISVFNFAELMQEPKLSYYCTNLISQHPSIVLSMDYEILSGPCLCSLLEEEKINLKEIDIIKLVFQWAQKSCAKKNIPVTGENVRSILEEVNVLSLLRFCTLSLEEIDSLPDIDSILTEQELSAIRHVIHNFKNIKHSTELQTDFLIDELNFPSISPSVEQRTPKNIKWFYCCRPMIRSVSPLIIDNTFSKVFVKIKSDHTVLVNSFLIPTRMSPQITFSNKSSSSYSEHIAVSIKLSDSDVTDDDSIVCNFINVVQYNISIYIGLLEPYIFKKHKWYTVTFIWPNEKSQPYKYPLSCRGIDCDRNVKFSFDDTCFDDGSFLEGLKFSL